MRNDTNTNIPIIQKNGLKLLEEYNLKSSRKSFQFPFNIDFSNNPEDSNELILKFIEEQLGLAKEKTKSAIIVHKSIGEIGLKWHIDDCQIITRNDDPIYDKEKFIKIAEGKYLFFNTPAGKLPDKTIIFYSSSYNIDFTGGILRLADSTEIFPKAGNGFMMDSREAHMVTPVKSGIRNVTLVKIY